VRPIPPLSTGSASAQLAYEPVQTYNGLHKCAASAAKRNRPTRRCSANRWWILYGLKLTIL
jgi:hypothetical protein